MYAEYPTDIGCEAGSLISDDRVPHWVLEDYNPDVRVEIPRDFGVKDIFEVRDGGLRPSSAVYLVHERALIFQNVPLTNAIPVRVFVPAGNYQVRQDVRDEL